MSIHIYILIQFRISKDLFNTRKKGFFKLAYKFFQFGPAKDAGLKWNGGMCQPTKLKHFYTAGKYIEILYIDNK